MSLAASEIYIFLGDIGAYLSPEVIYVRKDSTKIAAGSPGICDVRQDLKTA